MVMGLGLVLRWRGPADVSREVDEAALLRDEGVSRLERGLWADSEARESGA